MRVWSRLLLPVLLLSAASCDKPSEDECKKAWVNIGKVHGTPPGPDDAVQAASFVRQCRSQYSRESVQCVIRAQTPADLDACFGVKPEDKKAAPAASPDKPADPAASPSPK